MPWFICPNQVPSSFPRNLSEIRFRDASSRVHNLHPLSKTRLSMGGWNADRYPLPSHLRFTITKRGELVQPHEYFIRVSRSYREDSFNPPSPTQLCKRMKNRCIISRPVPLHLPYRRNIIFSILLPFPFLPLSAW